MQCQGKLMYETWENGKKPSFGINFDPFHVNLGPKKIADGFYPATCNTFLQDIIICNFKEN